MPDRCAIVLGRVNRPISHCPAAPEADKYRPGSDATSEGRLMATESNSAAKLTQSYVHGVSSVSLFGQTLGAYFDAAAARWAGELALVVRQQGIRWTYRELAQRVDDLAAGLLALGLKTGDRIGIWSPNNAEWAITQFATAKAGLILVNINPAYRLAEIEYALNKVGCKALITADSFKTSDYVGMLRELAPELDRCAPGA